MGRAEAQNVAVGRLEVEGVNLRLLPTAVVEGRVLDAASTRPIVGARVHAESAEGVIAARTAIDGRFRLAGVPPGRVVVRADADISASVPGQEVSLAFGETRTVDIALPSAATVAGLVVDDKGMAVAGASGRVGSFGARAGGDHRGAVPHRSRRPVQRAPGAGHRGRVAGGDASRLPAAGPGAAGTSSPAPTSRGCASRWRAGLPSPGSCRTATRSRWHRPRATVTRTSAGGSATIEATTSGSTHIGWGAAADGGDRARRRVPHRRARPRLVPAHLSAAAGSPTRAATR